VEQEILIVPIEVPHQWHLLNPSALIGVHASAAILFRDGEKQGQFEYEIELFEFHNGRKR